MALAGLMLLGSLASALGCTSPTDETATPSPSPVHSQVVQTSTSTPQPVPSPSHVVSSPTPTPQPIISRELAVSAGEEALAHDSEVATAVQGMHSTAARLMFAGDLNGQFAIRSADPEDLVWVVQVEGISLALHTVGTSDPEADRKYRFNAVVVDAETGAVIERLVSTLEPIILSAYFYSSHSRAEGRVSFEITAGELDRIRVDKDEAVASVVALLQEQYGERWIGMWDLESIEYEPVRLRPDYPSPPALLHPTTSPFYSTPTPYPPGTVFPIAWDIVVAHKFDFGGCEVVSIPPPPGMNPDPYRCWPIVHTYRVDASTGTVTHIGTHGGVGPQLSDEKYAVLERHAEKYGWWSVWHAFGESGSRHPDNFDYDRLVAALANVP